MPRRQRRSKLRRGEWTPRLHLALLMGPHPLDDVSDDELVTIYAEHRDELVADAEVGTWPWAAWAFAPDVPDELRADRPALVPEEEHDRDAAATAALEAARRRWLAERAA